MLHSPLQKLQVAVKAAAFHILQIPGGHSTASAMGPPHSLASMQLRLPLGEGAFDLNASGVHPALPMVLGSCMYQRPGWGIAVCGLCSVVGLRW